MNVLDKVKRWFERNTVYEAPQMDQALIDAERYLAQLDSKLRRAELRVESRREGTNGTPRDSI